MELLKKNVQKTEVQSEDVRKIYSLVDYEFFDGKKIKTLLGIDQLQQPCEQTYTASLERIRVLYGACLWLVAT